MHEVQLLPVTRRQFLKIATALGGGLLLAIQLRGYWTTLREAGAVGREDQ